MEFNEDTLQDSQETEVEFIFEEPDELDEDEVWFQDFEEEPEEQAPEAQAQEPKEVFEGEQDLIVDEKQAKTRLDKLVSGVFNLSRARVADLLKQELIQVNGKQVKASYKVQNGDQIHLTIPPLQSLDVEPEDMDLDIIYEDEDLLVVNKPSGLVVHPSPGHVTGTLVNGLLAHCDNLSGINGVMRPGIVHRIDKDTSGLLVVAKNDQAHQSLSKQLSDKSCKREYLAIVHEPFAHNNGTIIAPIGRDVKDRQKMAVTDQNSKDATTHFEVLENFDKYALVACSLETGRTHQIRVHMAYIDHPVAADPKYGRRKTLDGHGQYLHAYRLTFTHPRTGEIMTFEAEPDAEFQQALKELRAA